MVLFGLAVVILALYLAQIPIKFALRGLKAPLPFLIFIAIFQLFMYAPTEQNLLVLSIGPLNVTIEGILSALIVLLRFSALILIIGLASFSISTSDLIYGSQSLLKPLNKLGIPSEDITMVLQITLRFLPMLGQATEQIAKAQAARGAEWGTRHKNLIQQIKTIYPVIVPMFLTSLQRAENMALAMDARGYGNHIQRGSYKSFSFNKKDGITVLAAFILSILIVLL